MQCNNIQEIILADYLDGELKKEKREDIDAHLAQCHECQQFLLQAQKDLVAPLANLPRQEPSPRVWENIRERIEGPQEVISSNFLQEFLAKIKLGFSLPQLTLAAIMLVAVLGIIGSLTHNKINNQIVNNVTNTDPQEDMEYYAFLASEVDLAAVDGNGDYGTAIEEYFL